MQELLFFCSNIDSPPTQTHTSAEEPTANQQDWLENICKIAINWFSYLYYLLLRKMKENKLK